MATLYKRDGETLAGGADVNINRTIGLYKKNLVQELGLVFPAIASRASRSTALDRLFNWFSTVANMLRFDHHFDISRSQSSIAQSVFHDKKFKDMLGYVIHSMDTNVIEAVANKTVTGEYYLSLLHKVWCWPVFRYSLLYRRRGNGAV